MAGLVNNFGLLYEALPNKLSYSILRYIINYRNELGVAPSVRDISLAMGGISTNTVVYHLDVLEEEKFIRRIPGIARGIIVS